MVDTNLDRRQSMLVISFVFGSCCPFFFYNAPTTDSVCQIQRTYFVIKVAPDSDQHGLRGVSWPYVVLLYYKLLYTITMFIMIVIFVFDSELFSHGYSVCIWLKYWSNKKNIIRQSFIRFWLMLFVFGRWR